MTYNLYREETGLILTLTAMPSLAPVVRYMLSGSAGTPPSLLSIYEATSSRMQFIPWLAL